MADQSGHIDVHRRVIPPLYRDALTAGGVIEPIPGVDYPMWSLAQTLELMDRHRIQAAILSVTDPGVRRCSRSNALAARSPPKPSAAVLPPTRPTNKE
jgi:hypothetical protein